MHILAGCFAYGADFGDDALFMHGGLRDEMTMDDLHVLLLHEDALQLVHKVGLFDDDCHSVTRCFTWMILSFSVALLCSGCVLICHISNSLGKA